MEKFDWSALVFFLFFLFIVFVVILPSLGRNRVKSSRKALIQRIEKARNSRVIVLIHRQESVSLLGMPISRYIDIEDSEQILRAIRMTRPDVPIDLIVHTPGGLVLAAEQIANALVRREAPVTVMVPHYAMSGGTLLALSADNILMDTNAVLGPVDPQLGGMPAAGFVDAVERKGVRGVSDETLIIAGMAEKSLRQVHYAVVQLLKGNGMDEEKATYLADMLSTGQWTHDYAITYEEAQKLGLSVSDDLPVEVHQLMDLYPQGGNKRSSVQYISTPYRGGNGDDNPDAE